MDKQSKPDVVVNAVKLLKQSQFGTTAIKVEFEANLEREYDSNWDSDSDCHAWIMSELAELGLAERREDNYLELSHRVNTEWHPKGPLAYAEFYNDGSVDSEFTFTIKLDNPQNINLLPKVMRVWNNFTEAVQEDTGTLDISGSGMHMALINDSQCRYPTHATRAHLQRFDNFQRSMTLLLPAMYFLSSSNSTSRTMEYREPRITLYDGNRAWSERRQYKFSAITYNEGALEFRAFEPCYENPEVILDNFVVMSNAVRKYWRSKYRKTGIEKITRRCHFGNDENQRLDRLYVSVEHVDLLNEGLKRLKPSYYSIKQLKEQRQFGISKRTIKGALVRIKADAIEQYKEYEARFAWRQQVERYGYIQEYLGEEEYRTNLREMTPEREQEALERAEAYAKERLERAAQRKQNRDNFINEAVERFNNSRQARWALEA